MSAKPTEAFPSGTAPYIHQITLRHLQDDYLFPDTYRFLAARGDVDEVVLHYLLVFHDLPETAHANYVRHRYFRWFPSEQDLPVWIWQATFLHACDGWNLFEVPDWAVPADYASPADSFTDLPWPPMKPCPANNPLN